MKKERIFVLMRMLRVNQWIKNLVIFVAIVFSGKLFDVDLFSKSLFAFFVFCFLSSASYVLNDIIDYPLDKKHPVKKQRPIASGEVTIAEATFTVFLLTFASLIVSILFSVSFFLLSFVFILIHFFYSLYLKKHPIIDIFTISFSFMIRTFAGEVVSGYHIPIWLLLTIFFVSLFMATVKRHAELVGRGTETRLSLVEYKEHLLDFLTNTFATATIISFSFYTYFEKPPQVTTVFSDTISKILPGFEARKWLMISIPLVVYGIARYAQLLYQKEQGELPEKIITNDKPLIITILLWGLIMVGLIYIF
ncbi:MAG: UbiA prenyltransferase family protein [Candidatus Roizmanbacteria bacterium]|nr:MAG: UbiA prenyltransferase family protein [Candidatus Roizmanbacteria bacterium]